jgi:hypothetical protein
VSLGERIDCTTPAGKLQLHILRALAEFQRARIAERSGLACHAFDPHAPASAAAAEADADLLFAVGRCYKSSNARSCRHCSRDCRSNSRVSRE